MIAFRDFALRRGERLLLSNVDLALQAGWRVGVIGRNGTGKSSLFAAIQGEVEADRGDIDVPSARAHRQRRPGNARRWTIRRSTSCCPAMPPVHAAIQAERDAIGREDWEAVAEAHHRLEELNGYDATARAGKLLHGLGFPPDTHERAVKEFSGGWRVRLNLARALMTPSDLLLLDEPTNHLDLDAVLWLEQWLLKYPGTLLLISHDREFLDEVTTHTLHLHDGKAKLYTGDYTAFERQRAEHLRLQQITHEKVQAERAHLQSFIDRFSASAPRPSRRSRGSSAWRRWPDTEAVRAERALRIEFPAAGEAAARAAAPDPRRLRLSATHTVLDQVGFILEAGDRVAPARPQRRRQVDAGEDRWSANCRCSPASAAAIPTCASATSPSTRWNRCARARPRSTTWPTSRRAWRRSSCATSSASGISPATARSRSVDVFSGGERARLALALIAWRKPNVLLLDEPTNHLDLDMREALAEALGDFEGAIVLVSHDRHLIGLVCDTFWRVADGVAQPFDGDLDAYAVWLRTRDSGNDGKGRPRRRPPPPRRRRASPPTKARKANAHKLAQAEARVAELESKLHTLDMDLADPDLYAGGGTRGRAGPRSATRGANWPLPRTSCWRCTTRRDR